MAVNSNFFTKKKDFFTLKEVLEITNSTLPSNGNYDLDKKIQDVAILALANQNEISFLHNATYLEKFLTSKAGFCFIEEKFAHQTPPTMIPLINKNPYFAYSKFLSEFYFDPKQIVDVSRTEAIDKTAIIGKNTEICFGVVIGKNVKIGENCYIGANVVIGDNCQIGDNCVINALVVLSYCIIGNNAIIHNGTKIGQDGFGFAHSNGKLHKILQLGIVEIADDVEIGANTCIDRGAIGNTSIGKQVKIDNLVQIGHNVIIDEGTVIAGCSAIAGSTKVGKFVQIGGNSAIAGHITLGDGAKVAGKSGVAQNVLPMQSVGGYPALPIKDWHRITIKLMQLIKK